MNTPHKHAVVIKAWADGAKIEWRQDSTRAWMPVRTPGWVTTYEYRVAPKPPVKKYRYVYMYSNGGLAVSQHHYPEGAVTVGAENYKAIQKIDSTMIEVEEE